MKILIEEDGRVQEHPVEILFNYLSPATRGVLGLTQEEIPDLKRSDKVGPAIKV